MTDDLPGGHSTFVGDMLAAYKSKLLQFLVDEFGREREIHLAILHSALRDVEALARYDFLNRVSEARAGAIADAIANEGEEQ